jgi:archaellum biogenesis protein FlaJ (TadC family)
MIENRYLVTAATAADTVPRALIKDIVNRAVQITNLQDDLEEYLKTEDVSFEDVNPEYVNKKNTLVHKFKKDLQERMLRFF